MHLRPASRTSHFEESIIIGTREISGSEATRFKKCVIAFGPSINASSKLISMMFAPFSTCCLATDRASSYLFSLIKVANRGEPVTFVLSPTKVSEELFFADKLNGSSPESLNLGSTRVYLRGDFSFNF